MLKISKISDYAVVILVDLANDILACRSSSTVARSTKLPEPTVSKILKLLAKAGIVNSTRGINGGYSLVHPPEDISVEQIIRAIDGPISITSCSDDMAPDCSLIGSCSVRGRWNGVNTAIRNTLEVVTLADMFKFQDKGCNIKSMDVAKKEEYYGSH